jgi:hypothetical protein
VRTSAPAQINECLKSRSILCPGRGEPSGLPSIHNFPIESFILRTFFPLRQAPMTARLTRPTGTSVTNKRRSFCINGRWPLGCSGKFYSPFNRVQHLSFFQLECSTLKPVVMALSLHVCALKCLNSRFTFKRPIQVHIAHRSCCPTPLQLLA